MTSFELPLIMVPMPGSGVIYTVSTASVAATPSSP
jgi:hypothetical protein